VADARRIAARVIYEAAEGRDPAAQRKAERSTGTFGELADRYLEQHAKRHNKSWRQAAGLIDHNARPRWNKLTAASITRADVRNLLGRITSPTVANQTLAAVSAIFSWAVKQEIITANPCSGIERHATPSRERVLADSELPRLWAAIDDAGLVTSAALKTILLTGQRPGEVSSMRLEHIVDGGWWEMPGQPVPALGWPGTKNGQAHRVCLPEPVRATIAELTEGATMGFVFKRARGRPVNNLDIPMREVSTKLGIEPVKPHDLRRTHGTTIAKLGFGRDLMNRIQNHKEGGIASVYDRHAYAEEIKHCMEVVATHLVALAEGRSPADNVVAMEFKQRR
jgi:integrase